MWYRFTGTEQTSTGKPNQCCPLWRLAAKLASLSCLWQDVGIDADTSQPQTDVKTRRPVRVLNEQWVAVLPSLKAFWWSASTVAAAADPNHSSPIKLTVLI